MLREYNNGTTEAIIEARCSKVPLRRLSEAVDVAGKGSLRGAGLLRQPALRDPTLFHDFFDKMSNYKKPLLHYHYHLLNNID